MRAFFCLELDSTLKQQIYSDFSHFRRSAAKVSWVKPDNLHITLKFLGEIDANLTSQLEERSQQVLAERGIHTPIRVKFNRLGFFPNLRKPRVIWLGPTSPAVEINLLAKRLAGHLELLGFGSDQNSFQTHLTLGRIKDQSRAVEELVQLVERSPKFEYEAAFDHLTLMESELTSHGSIYRPVFQVPFHSD